MKINLLLFISLVTISVNSQAWWLSSNSTSNYFASQDASHQKETNVAKNVMVKTKAGSKQKMQAPAQQYTRYTPGQDYRWNYSNGYYTSYPVKRSVPGINMHPDTHFNQQQYDAHQAYLDEIREIQKRHQREVDAAQKAYNESMKQWYKQ